MKTTLLFLIFILPAFGYCQTYTLDSFDLEKKLYYKINSINRDLTHLFKLNKLPAYKNDSLITLVYATDSHFIELDEPEGLNLLFSNERDLEKGQFSFGLKAIGLIYPDYFAGIRLPGYPRLYIPSANVESKMSYRDLWLLKTMSSLLFGVNNLFEFENTSGKTCKDYNLQMQEYKIEDNANPFNFKVKLDSINIMKLNRLIRQQISYEIENFIRNYEVTFYRDSLLKNPYNSAESIDILYCKYVEKSNDSTQTKVHYFNCISNRLKQISFTKKSIGFKLNESVFYISYDYIKNQAQWFKLFCTIWDRELRKF
jgi:hypothetical protein